MASAKNVTYRRPNQGNITRKFEDVVAVDLVGDSDGPHMKLIIQHTGPTPNTVISPVTILYSVSEYQN